MWGRDAVPGLAGGMSTLWRGSRRSRAGGQFRRCTTHADDYGQDTSMSSFRDTAQHQAGISSVQVTELFGRYSYEIRPSGEGSAPSRLILLQGPNGAGKTTVLQLIRHLLSPARNAGHRTFMARTAFKRFRIEFDDGFSVEALRDRGTTGSYAIVAQQGKSELMNLDVTVDSDLTVRPEQPDNLISFELTRLIELSESNALASRRKKKVGKRQPTMTDFENLLKEHNFNPLYLADDRTLYTDDEELLRRREGRLWADNDRSPSLAEIAERELLGAVARVNELVRSLTLGGQRTGSESSHDVYVRVLRQLGGSSMSAANHSDIQGKKAEDRLAELRDLAPSYEEFGLAAPLDYDEMLRLLKAVKNHERQELAESIISTYLESLEARYAGLAEAERVLRSLVPTINEFLGDKKVFFAPREGLTVVTETGDTIRPTALSSGERQLLVLLCTTLLASQSTRLFIIDEPELSLSAWWQRKILDALLTVAAESSLQFIVATHSVEIMAGHHESLVQLHDPADD